MENKAPTSPAVVRVMRKKFWRSVAVNVTMPIWFAPALVICIVGWVVVSIIETNERRKLDAQNEVRWARERAEAEAWEKIQQRARREPLVSQGTNVVHVDFKNKGESHGVQ